MKEDFSFMLIKKMQSETEPPYKGGSGPTLEVATPGGSDSATLTKTPSYFLRSSIAHASSIERDKALWNKIQRAVARLH